LVAIRIIDSSLLIEAERRKLLPALEAHLSSSSKTIAPPRVYEETVIEPKSMSHFAASASRIEKLYAKCIEIEEPDYSEPKVSKIVDRVRECIAEKAAKAEHLVELADLQIGALSVKRATKRENVELIFREKALKAIKADHGKTDNNEKEDLCVDLKDIESDLIRELTTTYPGKE
jgi:hypothetical protein